ncbi:helix-turn-helix transcriptional regulator [Actinacidiphila alni]|nr:helix-turn-helix transcriptional regulator [Actinacidiphila alni]
MDLEELRLLRRARDRMDREYAQPLDVPALARTALMSAGHFSRQFRAAYGETPYSYLMTRRIERATALLRRGDISVTDACFAVGCTSLGSFSARFTQIVGETPSAYKARDHSDVQVVPGCHMMVITRPRKTGGAGQPKAGRPARTDSAADGPAAAGPGPGSPGAGGPGSSSSEEAAAPVRT